MSDLLIKGMEMPKDKPLIIKINPDGAVSSTFDNDYRKYAAIPVPPHGRLIDADEISEHKYTTMPPYRREYCDGKPKSEDEVVAFKFGWNSAIDAITENAPTIIEAEEGE